MKKGTVKYMRRAFRSGLFCSVPLCSTSSSVCSVSFHKFPADAELRAKWLVKIRRRDDFKVTAKSSVCGRHFLPEDIIKTAAGIRCLRKGAVPVLFEWNGYHVRRRLSVWERMERKEANCTDWMEPVNDGDGGAGSAGGKRADGFSRQLKTEQPESLAEISRPLAVDTTAVDESAQAAAAAAPLDEVLYNTDIKELEDHLYCRTTVQKQDQFVESSLQMSSPSPSLTVSHQEVIRFLLNRNDQSVESSLQVKTSPAPSMTVSHQEVNGLNRNDDFPDQCCEQCPKGCFYRCKQEHLITDTGCLKEFYTDYNEKPYQCDQCGKRLSSSTNLKNHQMIHTGEKPYHCDHCGKRSRTFRAFKNHMETVHSGEKQYHCDKCGKSFSTRDNLTIHLRSHTESYQCDQCGKILSSINGRESHQMIHTGEKPYGCDQCGKRFRTLGSLKSHMKIIHSGEKPYRCGQCGKGFSIRGNLRTHLRIHTGEKPYVCNLCGERFSSSSSVKSHQRNHTGEKRYHCGECAKSFSTRSELKTHKIIHSNERKPITLSPMRGNIQPTLSSQMAHRVHTG